MDTNNLLAKYTSLLIDYFDSQSLAYLSAGVFLLNVNTGMSFYMGIAFVICSLMLLISQLIAKCRATAQRMNRLFSVSLIMIAIAMLILGSLSSPKNDTDISILYIILGWTAVWATVKVIQICKIIGWAKGMIMLPTAYSLLMIFAGRNEPILYTIAIIGLSILPSILSSVWFHDI